MTTPYEQHLHDIILSLTENQESLLRSLDKTLEISFNQQKEIEELKETISQQMKGEK